MTWLSNEGWGQELVALGLVALALVYVVRKLTGWPRLRRKSADSTPTPVQLGGRLARGLDKAQRGRSASQ